MLRAALAGARRRKLRMLLSGLAVILGVTVVSGSMVLTGTLGRSIDRIFADAYAHTDVWVHGQPKVSVSEFEGEQVAAAIPARTLDVVEDIPGVAEATGRVEADGARVVGSDGKVVASPGPPRLGVNWTGEDELVQLRQGRGPSAPDEIALNVDLARAAGVSVGDRVGVLTLEPRQDFTLVGIFGYSGGRDSLGGVQEVAFTDQTAARLMLGQTGVWTAVSVRAEDGVAAGQLRDGIAATLGDGYQVRTADELAAEQSGQLREGLEVINSILLGFAGIALFVGVFLILNTFSILVAQRTRESALTRALGASRRQVLAAVLVEAALTGLVAAVVGLAAGIGLAALLARLATDFSSLPMAGLAVSPAAVVAAFTVGLLVTVAAALLPALRASRIPPVAALREAATADRPLTRLTLAGLALLAAGGAVLAAGLAGSGLWATFGGVLGCFVAMALLAPAVTRPAVAVIGRLFSFSIAGKLGRLNSGRNPRRTAVTASALMIGVALVSGVNVVAQSAKTSFAAWADDTIQAQLLITGEMSGARPPSFDAEVLERAVDLDGVRAAAGVYQDRALVDQQPTFVHAATDLAALADIYRATATEGDLATLGAGELAVDQTRAAEADLAVGDPVTVQLSRGEEHRLTVGAIFPDNALPGRYLVPPELADDMAVPDPYLGFIRLDPNAPADQIREQVTAWLADSPEVSLTDRSGFIEQQNDQLDTLLTVIQALLGLAILIAVLGIVNTLALSVLERTRELGLLRAVGLSRGATRRMVTVEAVVISLFGALLGVAVGTGLGAAVVQALKDEGIDRLALPWTDLGGYLLVAALVGVIAAVVPAIRAARTDVLAAIAYE